MQYNIQQDTYQNNKDQVSKQSKIDRQFLVHPQQDFADKYDKKIIEPEHD